MVGMNFNNINHINLSNLNIINMKISLKKRKEVLVIKMKTKK